MRATNPMHVHLYRVSRSETLPLLETLIKNISAQPLDKRLRQVTTRPIRLEESVAPDKNFQGVWRLSFLKFRAEGPGRVSLGKAAESITLEEGESFSEDTAALYDPEKNVLILQYNHYGPRAQAIEDYFTVYSGQEHANYSFQLQINRDAQARLKNKKVFTRLKFRIAPDQISKHWKEANIGLSTAFKRTAKIADGDWITVEIGLDRKEYNRSLDLFDNLKGFIGLVDEPREAVSQLEITGREDVGFAIDPVDLLKERVRRSYNNLDLDMGRRIPMETRWNCLYDAYSTWKQSGVI